MKKTYYICDICERDSDLTGGVYGVEVGENSIILYSNHKGSGKHICKSCIECLSDCLPGLLNNEKETV